MSNEIKRAGPLGSGAREAGSNPVRSTKVYTGKRMSNGNAVVHVIQPTGDSHLLPLGLDLWNHSPTGFEWGYAGSGPAQLALALLVDALGDKDKALRLHQQFKFKHIATLSRSKDWRMTDDEVRKFAEAL